MAYIYIINILYKNIQNKNCSTKRYHIQWYQLSYSYIANIC